MRDVMADLLRWWRAGEAVGVGTVTGTFRSAPRPAGASMLVGPDGTAVGSVSGGCVEGAVYELASGIRDGAEPRLQRYGVSDDDAFSVGLTCGGIIDVFAERIAPDSFPEFGELAAAVDAGDPVALATVVAGRPGQVGRHLLVWDDRTSGGLGADRIDDAVRDDVRGLLAHGSTATLTYGLDGQRRGEGLQIFVASFAPAPRMLVFGAIDFAAAVARMGTFLGYRVTVCDARPVFATSRRFPEADEVIVDWPHRYLRAQIDAGALDVRTVICVLTHDPKFDVPVLVEALAADVAYVGAMGSRSTHTDRLDRLREAGITPEQLDRLSSPIGLDLGARTPEETAVSIAAEIIAQRWRGGGRPLSATTGAIHREPIAEQIGR
ncbi:XdhC family protein [Nakamurella flavida]|uniref:XdhC family protein n=1 Tax=Nakamurella flavida TaxID=363630 RepID=A0A938YLH6_9ACTN|nr:XdhC/CoxI family protein [Nakamurella flavida]MBM9475602.1 XdhC family protein [Nakamurella flavida]MDP9778122.1 xanthine dehydrogenase accessory factor [Nakamurella flavida]